MDENRSPLDSEDTGTGFVARQPIFDYELGVYAYELLHRDQAVGPFTSTDPDGASSHLIDQTLHVHQLESLVGRKLAFVNVTANLLVDEIVRCLPKNIAVLELLETIVPTEAVIASCKELKEAGYRLALDDFVPRPELEPLVELADFLKIDFLVTTGEERRKVFDRYSRKGRQLLAEKVETQADYLHAREIGYRLFQGYFFCKPEIVQRRDVPRFKLNYLRFMKEMSRPGIDFDRVEEIVKGEISLSVRLLRFLNSATFGFRTKITSIRDALVRLGERQLKRWGSLVALSGLGDDKPKELIINSLVRARFIELLGAQAGMRGQETSLFLTGLFSNLDALLDRELEDLLPEIGVPEDVVEALARQDTPLGRIYDVVLAYERGDWDDAARLASISMGSSGGIMRIPLFYKQSVKWADSVFAPDSSQAA